MQGAYAAAGVEHHTAWVHESEAAMVAELSSKGYAIAESTRAMAMSLSELPMIHAEAAEIGSAKWATYLEYLRRFGLSETLLAGVDPNAFHVLAARLNGTVVATGLGFDHKGDCGIFNISTLAPARRRGIATALTAQHLQEAAKRGCETATLQSTPMAERVYGILGFRDLGRYLEFAPRGYGSAQRRSTLIQSPGRTDERSRRTPSQPPEGPRRALVAGRPATVESSIGAGSIGVS